MKPLSSNHHARFNQLFVVLHHFAEELLVRHDSRLGFFVCFDDDHDSHCKFSLLVKVGPSSLSTTLLTLALHVNRTSDGKIDRLTLFLFELVLPAESKSGNVLV